MGIFLIRYFFAIILLLGLLLAALPTFTHFTLERQLSRQLGATEIEQLELNLFRGRLTIEKLTIENQGASDLTVGQLHADVDMWELLSGRLALEALQGAGLKLSIKEDEHGHFIVLLALHPDNTAASDAEALQIPPFSVTQLQLTDSRIMVDTNLAKGALEISRLVIDDLANAPPEFANQSPPATLSLKGDWNSAAISIEAHINAFHRTPSFGGTVKLEQFSLQESALLFPPELSHLKLTGLLSIDLDTKLVLTKPFEYKISGDITFNDLALEDQDRQLKLLSVGNTELRNLELETGLQLGLESVIFQNIIAVDESSVEGQWLQAQEIRIGELLYQPGLLEIASIHSEGALSILRLTKEGRLVSQGVLRASLQNLTGSSKGLEQAEPPPPAFEWAIHQLSLVDGRVQFINEQLETPSRLDLNLAQLKADSLDSRNPGSASELLLRATVGEYGTVTVDGRFAPLSEQLNLNLIGKIDAIQLPLVSPYVEYFLGYELTAGQYDHRFDIKIENEQLISSNELKLRQLKVNKLQDADPASPLDVPLDFALNLLRDGAGEIELKVPVEGKLNDPEIGLEKIISRALSKALTAGSTTFLKLALQPYGAIWAGAEMGLKLATRMQLDPMPFEPGTIELSKEQQGYATKLAELMTERPGLQLTLCGVAGMADLAWIKTDIDSKAISEQQPLPAPEDSKPVIEKRMLELATARQDALKRHLVDQHRLEAKRLYLCKPRVDAKSELSGVQLGL